MHTTRISFLERLSDGDEPAWRDFDAVYKPLLRKWLQNHHLSEADREDLIQEILLFLIKNIAHFEHNKRTGAFRKWLRSSTVNITRNYLRKNGRENLLGDEAFSALLDGLEDPGNRLSRAFDLEHRQTVLHYLLGRTAKEFKPETVSIFQMYVLEDAGVEETAARHKVSKAAVYIAKSRVLQRLREKGGDWFDGLSDD